MLGIDPGSLKTGFGVIEFDGERLEHVNHGVIFVDDEKDLSRRLLALGDHLRTILKKYRPDHVVIEKIFLGKSVDSAFKLGHARGITLAEAARCGAEVHEYATRSVKKGVAGTGAAGKEEVYQAVRAQLRLQSLVNFDASDALALAIFHSYNWTAFNKMKVCRAGVAWRDNEGEL